MELGPGNGICKRADGRNHHIRVWDRGFRLPGSQPMTQHLLDSHRYSADLLQALDILLHVPVRSQDHKESALWAMTEKVNHSRDGEHQFLRPC